MKPACSESILIPSRSGRLGIHNGAGPVNVKARRTMDYRIGDGPGYRILPNGQIQMLGSPDGQTPWTRLYVGDTLQVLSNFSTGATTAYTIAAILDGSAAGGAGAGLNLDFPQHTVRMRSGDVFTVLALANRAVMNNAGPQRTAYDVSSRFN